MGKDQRGSRPLVASLQAGDSAVTASTLAAFWAVSILFVLTPGADWAYALSAGMRRAALPALGGLLLGHLVATLVVAAGVGAIVVRFPLTTTAVTVFGSCYLLALGIGMAWRGGTTIDTQGPSANTWQKWLYGGLCVSGLNPKVFLLFLALLPQFTVPSASMSIAAQMVTLGSVHVLSCTVVYAIVAIAAQKTLAARPRAALAVTRLAGVSMIAISLVLLVAQFSHDQRHLLVPAT